ncbi:hypothetical protein Tco_0770585 [Tanacetum coccineum]|uniref:Reverse transcriptase domain-containing protein n=1 Tax=Tanacetum coccineum TaxID=301880 RepID=A0ABQ4ZCL6_9ASTR
MMRKKAPMHALADACLMRAPHHASRKRNASGCPMQWGSTSTSGVAFDDLRDALFVIFGLSELKEPYERAARQLLEQAPHSPEYVPDPIELEDHVPVYIPKPEHHEDLVPAEDEAPIPPLPDAYLLIPTADIPEADTPPRKRLLLTTLRHSCEVGETSAAAAARQPGPTMAHRVDYSLVDTMETRFRDTQRRMMVALEMVKHEWTVLPGPRPAQTARECSYSEFLKCKPLDFKGTEGVIRLTRWFEKMESVFNISNCTASCQCPNATCTLQETMLLYMWNAHGLKTLPRSKLHAHAMGNAEENDTDSNYKPEGEIKKIETEMWKPYGTSGTDVCR